MAYKENWVTEACSYSDKMSQIESPEQKPD